jgi:GntR family transcriptional regulator, transcriptional repressor for pyruvate dehydrogenase complex
VLLDQVKDHIRSLSPGDRLPNELALSQQFGVSRSSIREVIMHLCALGVLERSKKRGTHVRKPSLEDISRNFAFQLEMAGPEFEELKHARIFLEQSITGMLIQYATPISIERLNTLVTEMEALADRPREAHQIDRQFHATLAGICGNRLIEIFFQVINLTFQDKYRQKFLNARAVRKSAKGHRRMIECIKQKDSEGLKAVIEEHLKAL